MAAAIWIRQPDCPRSKPGACIDEARVVVEPHVGLDGTDARDALPPRPAALAKAGESGRRCKQTKTGLYSMHVESTGVVRGAIVSSVLPPVTWPGSGMRRGRRHVIAILFIAAFVGNNTMSRLVMSGMMGAAVGGLGRVAHGMLQAGRFPPQAEIAGAAAFMGVMFSVGSVVRS